MKYKRLAGSKRGLGKWHTLWMGDDHLLAVESTGYSEEYTRYYYKDIQAVTSHRTVTGKVWNGILGTVLAVFASIALFILGADKDPSVWVVLAVFSSPFLLMLCWNIFRGPTCRCYVRTPVGVVELPSLERVRYVKKCLEKIRPLVTQLQGVISRQEISGLVKAAADRTDVFPTARPVKVSPTAVPLPESGASDYRGGPHLAAFLLLLSDAGLSCLQMIHNSKTIVILAMVVCLIFIVLSIMALIRQKTHYVPAFAKWMTWGGVATLATGATIGYFFMIFLNVERFQGGMATQDDMLNLYASIQPSEHPAFAGFLLVYAIVAAAISCTGLVSLVKWRTTVGRPQQ